MEYGIYKLRSDTELDSRPTYIRFPVCTTPDPVYEILVRVLQSALVLFGLLIFPYKRRFF